MMAILMGNDIGAGEIARRAEALAELIEERQVQIDMLVARAIEWPRGRLASAAAGGRSIIVWGECRGCEADPLFLQQRRPDILGRANDLAGELAIGIVSATADILPGLAF